MCRRPGRNMFRPAGPLMHRRGSPPYPELRARAKRVVIDDIAVLVASLDDLEAMQRASDRPKDRLDLEEIEVIRRLRARGAIY